MSNESSDAAREAGSDRLAERLQDLDRRIGETVERVVREAQGLISERVRSGSDEMLRQIEALRPQLPSAYLPPEEVSSLAGEAESVGARSAGELLSAAALLDARNSQREVLSALLDQGLRFASRTAFFLTRPGEIIGWMGRGFGDNDGRLEGAQLPFSGQWAELAEGRGCVRLGADSCAELARAIEAEPAEEALLIPVVLRGQLAGALYADRTAAGDRLGAESLQLLTYVAMQTIETSSFRGYGACPALHFKGASETEPGVPLWTQDSAQDSADSAPSPPPEPPPEETTAEVAVAPEPTPHASETVLAEPTTAEMATPSGPPPQTAEETRAAPAEAEEETAGSTLDLEDVPPLEEAATGEPLEEASELWTLEEDEAGSAAAEPSPPVPAAAAPPPAPQPPPAAGPPGPAPPVAPPPQEALGQVGQKTVRLDLSSIPGQAAEPPPAVTSEPRTSEVPAPPAEETAAAGFELQAEAESEALGEETGVGLIPDTEGPATEELTTSVADDSEDPTLVTARPPAAPPPAVAVPPPAAPPEAPAPPVEAAQAPAPAGEGGDPGGSTEVRPPADLDGPGLAFAGEAKVAIPEGEEALHEEARRLARLLVSEIKLYNEELIEEGRREGNIYERLKEDIDRSRQMYEERIDPRIRERTDYFLQELVQRLAGGDSSLLGM